jgi:leucyl aminopeptidase
MSSRKAQYKLFNGNLSAGLLEAEKQAEKQSLLNNQQVEDESEFVPLTAQENKGIQVDQQSKIAKLKDQIKKLEKQKEHAVALQAAIKKIRDRAIEVMDEKNSTDEFEKLKQKIIKIAPNDQELIDDLSKVESKLESVNSAKKIVNYHANFNSPDMKQDAEKAKRNLAEAKATYRLTLNDLISKHTKRVLSSVNSISQLRSELVAIHPQRAVVKRKDL